MKDPAGNAAPAGGFKNNGWYSGYNYWNGQFAQHAGDFAPGNPNGSGTVSADVVAQTSKQNVDYINNQRSQTGAAPIPSTNQVAKQNNNQPPVIQTANTSPSGTSGLFSNASGASGLNLPSMYTNLTQQAGIPDLQTKADQIQAQIDAVQQGLATATSTENENPFLSEANRVGRVEKLNTDAQNQIDALTNEKNTILGEINQKSTDIQNQIGLATQQYTLDDQARQEALGQFNTLLSSGLLSNLSSSDVTKIAQSTGLPTDIIQSAITASQRADQNVQMVQTSSGITLIDANTGNIIKSVDIPGMTSGSGLTATQQKEADAQANQQSLIGDIQAGHTLQELINTYAVDGSGLTVDQIYNLYNQYSPRGAAKETLKQIKSGQYANQPNFQQDPTAPGYVKPKSTGFFGL